MIEYSDLVLWVMGDTKPDVPKDKLGLCIVNKAGCYVPENLDNVVGLAYWVNYPYDEGKIVNTEMMKKLGDRIQYAEFYNCEYLTDLTPLTNLKNFHAVVVQILKNLI